MIELAVEVISVFCELSFLNITLIFCRWGTIFPIAVKLRNTSAISSFYPSSSQASINFLAKLNFLGISGKLSLV